MLTVHRFALLSHLSSINNLSSLYFSCLLIISFINSNMVHKGFLSVRLLLLFLGFSFVLSSLAVPSTRSLKSTEENPSSVQDFLTQRNKFLIWEKGILMEGWIWKAQIIQELEQTITMIQKLQEELKEFIHVQIKTSKQEERGRRSCGFGFAFYALY
ncbi:uncharacterized protein LOC110655749 isoform X1 [Hevea brasiliensis]|uniref:uncharacterized protein LOC110655749 isoform X1 n=1 Tax=Hevea brasiliensis TaxID=3981 RepID=UPI000B7738DC|nr:uncharacterized protein LOC110655749 isoform X1 [Hevea brasiliensis]